MHAYLNIHRMVWVRKESSKNGIAIDIYLEEECTPLLLYVFFVQPFPDLIKINDIWYNNTSRGRSLRGFRKLNDAKMTERYSEVKVFLRI